MMLFKKAIEDMAASSLRCVTIAYRTYDLKDIPTDEEQLTEWALPEDELILLAIVGLKVCMLQLSFLTILFRYFLLDI